MGVGLIKIHEIMLTMLLIKHERLLKRPFYNAGSHYQGRNGLNLNKMILQMGSWECHSVLESIVCNISFCEL